MSPELLLFARSLGIALLHSLWQGAVIGACLGIVFRLVPQAAAKLRYHLSVSALLFLFVWFATTWAQQYDRMHLAKIVVTESAASGQPVKTYTVGAAAPESALHFSLSNLEPALPWLTALYIAGLLFMLARFCVSIAMLYRLRSNRHARPDHYWQNRLQELCRKMDIDRQVLVRLSHNIAVPIVTGFIKPMILLPVASASQLSQDQLEAILLHELAHIKRNDYLVNIVQAVIETVLFFNPFMWRISAVIRREREHCCDDLVLIHSSHPLPYAMALATLETQRGTNHYMALAASGKKQDLFNRIKRIMEMKKENLNYGRLIAAALLVAVIGVSAVWLTPVFAQNHKDETRTVKKRSVTWISDETLTVKDNNGKEKTYNSLEEWPESEKLKMAREYAHNGTELYFGKDYRQLKLNEDGNTTSIIIPKAKPFNTQPPGPPSPVSALRQPPAAPEEPEAPETPELPAVAEVHNSINQIDWNRVNKSVEEAAAQTKNIDWNQIRKNMSEASRELKNIDWVMIEKQVNDGLAEAQEAMNSPEVKREIRKSMEIARKETAKAMDEARLSMDQAREETRKAIEEARRDMEEKRRDMQEKANTARSNSYDKMLSQMDADGLIDRDQKFRVEKKDDRLYINGEAQSDAVYNKYKSYLKGDQIKIKGSANTLSIDITN